jgi:hypothetical protein
MKYCLGRVKIEANLENRKVDDKMKVKVCSREMQCALDLTVAGVLLGNRKF